MAGTGSVSESYTAVGDKQYDVTVTFEIAFDWGGYNYNGASYEIWCDGQVQYGTTTFSVPSGGGSWKWTTIGSRTFRITMDKSGASKTVATAAGINTGVNPSWIRGDGSVTLPARIWEWAVKYNANGGNGAPSTQTKTKGVTLKLSSTKPTRTGYTFQGWATSASGSVAYQPGANYIANAAVTLYAIWKKITYTVSYNANGGSGAPGAQTKIYGETLKLSTTKPSRNLYNFKGWGTSAGSTSASYQPGANYTDNAGVTLYAVWELAWVAPRITNISVDRCDSAGTSFENGTYAKVVFNWATDRTVSSVKIEHKATSATTWTATTVTATGTSSSVNTVIGGGTLDVETTYDVRITVADSVGNTVITRQVSPMSFAIDFKVGGDGAAFGKPASLSNTLEIAYRTKLTGGLTPVDIPANSDLNNYTTPGFYRCRYSADVKTIANVPVQDAFSLEVTENDGPKQVFTTYENSVFSELVRQAYNGTWGPWYRTNIATQNTLLLSVNGRTRQPLTIFPGDANGDGVMLGGIGGRVIIGGGESATTFLNGAGASSGATESVDICCDSAVSIHTNLQTAYANRKTFIFKADGDLHVPRYANINGVNLTMRNNVLYGPSSGSYMHGAQTITMSQKVSAQPNGIVLCWGWYNTPNVPSVDLTYCFVPKDHVLRNSGKGINCVVGGDVYTEVSNKYVYITDTTISGYANNTAGFLSNLVLFCVLGV